MSNVHEGVMVLKLKSGEELVGLMLDMNDKGYCIIGFPYLVGFSTLIEFFPFTKNRVFPISMVDMFFCKDASDEVKETYLKTLHQNHQEALRDIEKKLEMSTLPEPTPEAPGKEERTLH